MFWNGTKYKSILLNYPIILIMWSLAKYRYYKTIYDRQSIIQIEIHARYPGAFIYNEIFY